MIRKLILSVLPWIIITVLLFILYFKFSGEFPWNQDKIEVNSQTVLDKVEVLGKMELTKYYLTQDLSLKKTDKIYGFFDYTSEVVILITGEAVGCIDLTKLSVVDIIETDSTIAVTLPAPEICYHKVDLQKSRILEVGGSNKEFDAQNSKLIEEGLKRGEKEILRSALEMGILEETKKNALIILKPLFSNISGKDVQLSFRIPEDSLQLN